MIELNRLKQSSEGNNHMTDIVPENHQTLNEYLEIQRLIHGIQETGREKLSKLVLYNCDDPSALSMLESRALASGRPMIESWNFNISSKAILLEIIERLASVLSTRGPKERKLLELCHQVKEEKIDLVKLVNAVMKGDSRHVRELADSFSMKPEILLLVTDLAIQPFLQKVASKVTPSLLEAWWKPYCPVCGRKPIVARLKNRKRYLVCSLCGAEYLADLFLCVHCGNADPRTKQFLLPSQKQGFRIDFCEKCKHYLKVIDESKSKHPIPKGLEDLLTLQLDKIANDAGLIRD